MSEQVFPPALLDFYNQRIGPILNLLISCTYPLELIQRRFDSHRLTISRCYGRPIDLKVIAVDHPAYAGDQKMISMSNTARNGIPIIDLYMPALERQYAIRQKLDGINCDAMWQSVIVMGVLHELDHLANGWTDCAPGDIPALIEYERLTWGKTSEYGMVPWVQNYGQILSPLCQRWYDAWIAADRDVDHPSWVTFVTSKYGGVKHAPR
ncbi:MAG: hypothetical protein V4519_02605 [Patescibacteria group bacterium]